MSLRAPGGSAAAAAAAAAAVFGAVAATASLWYAVRRYRRAAARALPSSSSPRTLALRATPHQPLVRRAAACSRPFSWVVFWDLENVHVPSAVSPAAFVHALCDALRSVAPHSNLSHKQAVLRILAVANINTTPLQQRKSLQSNGVSILHFETDGRKDACDKALITELCLLPREHAPPMGVALLSADVDFAYALSRITALGYHTVVVAPNMATLSRQLASVPNVVLTFDHIFAHFSPLIVPQSQNNPNAKPAPAQKQSDKKQPASRNGSKQKQNHGVKLAIPQQPADPKQRATRTARKKQHSPNVKPGTTQQGADKKPPNARKQQKNAKTVTKPASSQQDAEKKPQKDGERQAKSKTPKQPSVVTKPTSSQQDAEKKPQKTGGRQAKPKTPKQPSVVTKLESSQHEAEKKPQKDGGRQPKPRTRKQPPVVSTSISSTDNTNAQGRQPKVSQRSSVNDAKVLPVTLSHFATATHSPDSGGLTPKRGATWFSHPIYFVSLLAILCTLGVLLWFLPAHFLRTWWPLFAFR